MGWVSFPLPNLPTAYKRLTASKANKELEERIENLETIATKD